MKSVLELIHQVIANLVHKFDLKNNYLEDDDPWSGILADTYFVVKIICRTMLQTLPGQIAFGRDMILNTPFIYDWVDISRREQQLIDKATKTKIKTSNCATIET